VRTLPELKKKHKQKFIYYKTTYLPFIFDPHMRVVILDHVNQCATVQFQTIIISNNGE
jgi:hypothetical protein